MVDQIIPGWYDTPGAMEELGGISRDAISKIARAEGWQSRPAANGNATFHKAEDVHEYRGHQERGRLARQLGWKAVGATPLCRIDDIDISCPVCDAYAIEWPAPPYLAEKWLCVEGHEGKLE